MNLKRVWKLERGNICQCRKSEENTIKVFEPKFTTKTSGMGLGLAMVKNIVETYNGSITFTSDKDTGTVFKVTFPKEN